MSAANTCPFLFLSSLVSWCELTWTYSREKNWLANDVLFGHGPWEVGFALRVGAYRLADRVESCIIVPQ